MCLLLVSSAASVTLQAFYFTVDALVISRADSKDGSPVVARAIIFMLDLFRQLDTNLEDRPSSYWFAMNSQGE